LDILLSSKIKLDLKIYHHQFQQSLRINPITDPINIETAFGIEFILIRSSLYDLFLINKSIPAINKITNKVISNNSFEIDIEAPKNAKGIEPTKYGTSKLRLRFPDLT
jgi:hypothetical protein